MADFEFKLGLGRAYRELVAASAADFSLRIIFGMNIRLHNGLMLYDVNLWVKSCMLIIVDRTCYGARDYDAWKGMASFEWTSAA